MANYCSNTNLTGIGTNTGPKCPSRPPWALPGPSLGLSRPLGAWEALGAWEPCSWFPWIVEPGPRGPGRASWEPLMAWESLSPADY